VLRGIACAAGRRFAARLAGHSSCSSQRNLIQVTKRSMWAETPCPETSHGAMNHLPVHPWSGIMVLRAADQPTCRLSAEDLPVFRSATTSKAIFCPSIEETHASAFDRTDVHEDILAAIIRLNEAEAFLVIEPLHGSFCHIALLSGTCISRRASAQPICSRFGEKSSVQTRECAARPSRSAEARLVLYGPFSAGLQGYPARVLRRGWLFGQPAPMFVLRIAIWDHHHQQCEATKGTAYLSIDIRPCDAGRVCSASKS
jgi:hypothetical protein